MFSEYKYGVWLGFSDIQTEGQIEYVSLKNARSILYARWIGGEPNNLNGREHYALYWASNGWHDFLCSKKINYECTKPIDN